MAVKRMVAWSEPSQVCLTGDVMVRLGVVVSGLTASVVVRRLPTPSRALTDRLDAPEEPPKWKVRVVVAVRAAGSRTVGCVAPEPQPAPADAADAERVDPRLRVLARHA